MLNSKKKEFLYALTGFGPNLIMVMLMAYFLNAVDPRGLKADAGLWGVQTFPIIVTAVFGVLFTIGRIFDGVIDVPLASLVDRMKNRYARIKVPIIIGFVPMVLGAVAMCLPLQRMQESGANTAWFFIMSLVFYTSYTLVLIAFYGSLSTICKDRAQRTRISFYKSFIDTVGYALAYAVAPIIMKGLENSFEINILHVILGATPLMLTALIPLFILKQKDSFKMVNIPEQGDEKIERPKILKSIAFVFKNKAFWPWLVVNSIAFMGLQMFLTSQNVLISGVLQLDATWSAVLNTAAFAPVPLMLWLYNKLIKKKGVRFAYQIALFCFAIGIMGFFAGSAFFFPNSIIPRIVINLIGGTIASFAIGSFFMMPVMVSAQIAAVELKVTKRNNSAMYFAGQAAVTSIAAAIATGIIYTYALKPLIDLAVNTSLVAKHTEDILVNGEWIRNEFTNHTYLVPLGGLLAPILVAAFCLIAFAFTFFMPKSYDAKTIGKIFDKNYVPDAEDLKDAEVKVKDTAEPVKSQI